MEASLLRRKDTTKGPPLRILSLDGGGVRGYSVLIILQEIMYKTYVEMKGEAPRREQIPKPCEHFDLIAGTGTGGLLALMLGRLRMDIETCKEVYIRMTRYVFETDKTIAGIPYRSTLFKASKLEEAIRQCVADHTIRDAEGNDGSASQALMSPLSPRSPASAYGGAVSPRRTLSRASVASSGMSGPGYRNSAYLPSRRGNPNALLYDSRENRTKTAVTAIYRGTPKNGQPVLLRSYDSRREPPPDFNCTIWQAGRATCATGLAFKPIQIGQSVFIDEGAGKYNPSPQVLDEATVNEWPGRDVGTFISIGTGKRPPGTNMQQHLWWEGFVSSPMGDFAEARRRLISKIEGCEETHVNMCREHLSKRGVNAENYYRLNVEVGVGEFGMNEWNRLVDISTNTHRYLARTEVQTQITSAATKMAKIHNAHMRLSGRVAGMEFEPGDDQRFQIAHPLAVELPGAEIDLPRDYNQPQQPSLMTPAFSFQRPQASDQDKYIVVSPSGSEAPEVLSQTQPLPPPPPPPPPPHFPVPPARRSGELPRIGDGRRSNEAYSMPPRSSMGSLTPSPRRSSEHPDPAAPASSVSNIVPPVPPKTPLPYPDNEAGSERRPQQQLSQPPARFTNGRAGLPYPDLDGPPPPINLARKPEYRSS